MIHMFKMKLKSITAGVVRYLGFWYNMRMNFFIHVVAESWRMFIMCVV